MALRSWKDIPVTLGFVVGLLTSLGVGVTMALTAGKQVFVERAVADSLEIQIGDIYEAVNQSEIDRTRREIASLKRLVAETRYRGDISEQAKDEIIGNTEIEIELLLKKLECLKKGHIKC